MPTTAALEKMAKVCWNASRHMANDYPAGHTEHGNGWKPEGDLQNAFTARVLQYIESMPLAPGALHYRAFQETLKAGLPPSQITTNQ